MKKITYYAYSVARQQLQQFPTIDDDCLIVTEKQLVHLLHFIFGHRIDKHNARHANVLDKHITGATLASAACAAQVHFRANISVIDVFESMCEQADRPSTVEHLESPSRAH